MPPILIIKLPNTLRHISYYKLYDGISGPDEYLIRYYNDYRAMCEVEHDEAMEKNVWVKRTLNQHRFGEFV
jgi:hypothetical protein